MRQWCAPGPGSRTVGDSGTDGRWQQHDGV
jgi:hypothetical protein